MNDEQQELEYMMKHIDRLLHGKTDQFKREMYRRITTSLWTLENLEAGSVDGIDVRS